MQSKNFEFLRPTWPELANLGGFAEVYLHTDPSGSLVKLRILGENVVKNVYSELNLPKTYQNSFLDLLNNDAFKTAVPHIISDKLNALRLHGNKAAHGDEPSSQTASWLLKEAFDIARWLSVQFKKTTVADLPKFTPISSDLSNSKSAKLKREKRELYQKYAAKEAENKKLLEQVEALRQQKISKNAALGAARSKNVNSMSFIINKPADAFKPSEETLKKFATEAENTANILEFNETETRKRIVDSLIAAAGWNVAKELTSTAEVGQEVEVDQQPNASGKGYADYVLWDDDASPLAVIEVKKASVEPELGRQQAKLYADSLEQKYGQRPIIFYTNGYDIWIWDDAGGYPPRKIYGYYSKDSLQYLVKYQRLRKAELNTLSPNSEIINRLYQTEAVKRVTERFTQKHRKSLVVMATGTGKTRVCIALIDVLVRAGWVKRVLFLCDRRELRKQAKNSFNDLLPTEPTRVITGSVDSSANERIFLATYPAMQKVFQSFDVGFFDLIVADESHRSVYNIYGDLFRYFDGFQIGMTATPVKFITKNTFELFLCEDEKPTAYYGLEEAITDRWLTKWKVIDYTTTFMRHGIKLETLTAKQLAELEEKGEDPQQYDFEPTEIDKVVYNKDTNRIIIRNLMEDGIRDVHGQTIGKSIIFARNHQHAVILRQLFDEMYPQYGGNFCQVIDTYDPRAEQLIDDFKENADGKNDQLKLAISVDMLDTGIDIPEIVNLVFAKPIKSQVKFWQMIGRGTRLSEDLYGPGQDKSEFLIFDHWGNFERFESGYESKPTSQRKSLAQTLFEFRLELAELALQKSEVTAFDLVIKLIEGDIKDLPEETIAVRERWREKRALENQETLQKFEPSTVKSLRETIAPLMQWRNILKVAGAGAAYSFDLTITKMQAALLQGSSSVDDFKIEILEQINELQMHLNPVRQKADEIKKIKSDDFWNNLSFEGLENLRKSLREIMHYREKTGSISPPAKIIDISEEKEGIVQHQRTSKFSEFGMKAYRETLEEQFIKFKETKTYQRIQNAEEVSDKDVNELVSMILVETPAVDKGILEEFFSETAGHLSFAIRSIIGLSPKAVEKKLSAFVLEQPSLTAKQTSFIKLVKNHIIKYGSITKEKLYDKPFTSIDAEGPDGIFESTEDLESLMAIIDQFAPPTSIFSNINKQELKGI